MSKSNLYLDVAELQRLMQRSGVTTFAELSRICGLHTGTIAKLMARTRDGSGLTIRTANILARAFGVRVCEITKYKAPGWDWEMQEVNG